MVSNQPFRASFFNTKRALVHNVDPFVIIEEIIRCLAACLRVLTNPSVGNGRESNVQSYRATLFLRSRGRCCIKIEHPCEFIVVVDGGGCGCRWRRRRFTVIHPEVNGGGWSGCRGGGQCQLFRYCSL